MWRGGCRVILVARRSVKISANSLRKGLLLPGTAIDGGRADHVLKVLETSHVKPGKGVAYMKAKLRNLDTSTVVSHSFRSGERVEMLDLEDEEVFQYLYHAEGVVHLMNMEELTEVEISTDTFGEKMPWLKEGMEVRVRQHQGRPIALSIPQRSAYQVHSTVSSSVKSNDNGKPATLSNGVTIKVPHFVSNGDFVLVDTEEGTYAGKAEPDEA